MVRWFGSRVRVSSLVSLCMSSRLRVSSLCVVRSARKAQVASTAPTRPTNAHMRSIARSSDRSAVQLNQPTMRPSPLCSDCLLAPGIADRIAVEMQIQQTGPPLDQLELGLVEVIGVADHFVQFVERGAQRGRAARPRAGDRSASATA